MIFNLIVAHTFKDNGIGKGNQLPWETKNYYILKKVTTQTTDDDIIHYVNSVIMGRKTWDSIPESNKPLKDRLNIIITNKNIKSQNKFVIYCKWEDLQKNIIKFNNELHKLIIKL